MSTLDTDRVDELARDVLDRLDETTPAHLTRTFEAELVEGDGRTLVTRIVPYGVEAIVADPPEFRPYRERFEPGAFERQVRAPDRLRVFLNFEHDQGISGIVGHGVSLDDRGDELLGRFRVHPNADGDKALHLIEEKQLTGVSMEFAPLRSKLVDGVVRRLRAHIDKVSLCRFPAYASAGVLEVREQPPGVELDGEEGSTLVERLRAERDRELLLAPLPLADDLELRLRALDLAPLRRIATTSKPWDGSPARFTDEQYLRSCLIVRSGDAPPKERGSLPVLEPDGTLNTNALGAAAGALAGARGGVSNVSSAQRAAAARKLVRYYGAANMTPPPSLVSLARS